MIFADNPHDREIEKMMQKTPHFRPRGHGVFVSEKSEYNAERCGCKECADRKKKRRVSGEKTPCVEQRIHEGQIPQPRVLMETFTAVTNPEFIIRINGYIKNDIGNKHSPTTIVAAITSRQTKAKLPTHVEVAVDGLTKDSIVLLEQIRTIDKNRLTDYVGRLDKETMGKVDKAIVISFGIKYLEELLR